MLSKALQGAAKGLTVDSDFENVTLLLHGNGTNGAQNNTFLDSSTNNFTITRNGNTTQGTFTPYGDNWSNYFDGAGDYIENTSNYLVASTTSTFTIEAWVFMTADPVDDANDIPAMISVNCGGGNNSFNYMAFGPISSRKLRIRWFDGTAKNAEGSTTLALNTWYHVACSVSSNAIKMFVNGVEETLSGTTTLTNRNGDANGFALGQTFTYANYTGYISNARVLSGTALYTTGFTPSTAPLTAITNTVLLTCQSNRFRDASSNAYAITTAGNTSVQRFSPFSPTAAYASGTIGGSGYFDGTGDYLTAPDNAVFEFGTGDFVIEGWFYPTTSGTVRVLSAHFSSLSGWSLELTTGDLLTFWSGDGSTTGYKVTSTNKVITNQWNYCAVSRSGTSLNTFINGVSGTAVTDSTNIADNTATVGVAGTPTGTFLYTGYSCDLRIRKGSAITSSTVPTAPLTAITNTSLLTNFTNAGIIDNAMMNDLETVGNAQISTTQSKFGGSSMYFDGTGDWLLVPSSQNFNMGTGDWTVECWAYASANTARGLFQITTGHLNATATGIGIGVSTNSGNPWRVYHGTTATDTGTNIVTSTWIHVAFVRSGSSVKLYLDGTSVYTATDSSNLSSYTFLTIGAWYDSNYPWNGYIDDLRITKGVARYTANFTAPTAPFADQ